MQPRASEAIPSKLGRRQLLGQLAPFAALTLALACAPSAPKATATPRSMTPVVPSPTPAGPSPTAVAPWPGATIPARPVATVAPPPAAVATPRATIDLHLWNGSAQLQLDGANVLPGVLDTEPGLHHLAALLNGQVARLSDITLGPDATARVDLVLPTPLPPLAVIVENSPEARPQSGLQAADVVYETLAEGGISRFMAVYLSQSPTLVGPVRSLRHYFAFLAAEYGADLVHIGSSPQGFAWRDALHLGKLDESAGDPGVWRSNARAAPHNAYTDAGADRQLLTQRGRQHGDSWGPLRFAAGPVTAGDRPGTSVSIDFKPWDYNAIYAWDAAAGRYRRFMSGVPHRDAVSGEQISASTVVVQFVEMAPIAGDTAGRLDIGLDSADGRLLVYGAGRLREGTWKKGPPAEPTRWLDATGQPMVLTPGPVWVEIVPATARVA